MKLGLRNGNLTILQGSLGSQYSANVGIELDNDPAFDGYTASMAIKYKDTSGGIKENTLTYKDGKYITPAAVYKVGQVVLITVSNTKGSETVVSEPLYIRISEGTNGENDLSADETTWQGFIDGYVEETVNEKFNENKITVDQELSEESENPVQNKTVKKNFDDIDKKIQEIDKKIQDIDIKDIAGDGEITKDMLDPSLMITVDQELSEESENPVQNKIVKKKFDDIDKKIQESFNHIDRDVETLQNAFKSVNTSLQQEVAAGNNHANGFMFGDDGLLYLTHDGEIISNGIKVAAESGGLAFNGGYQDEEGKVHLTMDGEDIEGFDPFLIAGGTGSNVAGSKLVFAMYSASTFSILSTSTAAELRFRFSSVDSESKVETGSGNLAIYVGGILKESRTVQQGDNTVDVFSYLSSGSNTVKLVLTDAYGTTATRTVTVTMESFTLEWNLGDTIKNTGFLTVYVTPTGSGAKTLHLMIDGSEYDTKIVTTSGRRVEFTVPLSVGSHTVSVYGTMTISNMTMTSDTLTCEVAEVSDDDSRTVIAAKVTVSESDQYSTINIPYRVICPTANPAEISLLVNDEVIGTETVDQSEYIWTYRFSESGNIVLGIQCGDTLWSRSFTINELSAEISEISDNLVLKVDPNKISDLDSFDYSGITMSTSNYFDTFNGGITADDEGIRCIKVMKGDRLTINYNLFGSDARATGRNMKFIYKIDNATDFDGQAISCLNGNIGLDIRANGVSMATEQTSLQLQTCEGYKTELELNIEPDSDDRIMMFWEKGTPAKAAVYAANDNFQQRNPVGITIGSDTCDVYLYLVRVYTRDLTKAESKANFFADGKDSAEIMSRYDRNQVYDSSGRLDPDKVASLNPYLHVLTWHAAGVSEAKSQKITGSLTHKYINGGAEHAWTAEGVIQKAQGTSSLGYVQAGCNEDFELANGLTTEDGTHKDVYSMTDESIGVNYFNFKTNVASQEHINNILVSEWYNKYQPYLRQARQDDPRVRDTVEGHMAVLFFHNTGETAVQVGATNVQPDETVFYSLGCLNNSKKNNDVFAYDDIVVEVSNNTADQCRFKSDDLSSETWDGNTNFEFRYLNKDIYSEDEAKSLWQDFLSWVVSLDADNAPDQLFETARTVNGQTYTADSAEYRKAAFKQEAASRMVMDSVLWHDLITLVFSEVDNRAKNTFWGYSKDTGLWHLVFSYDNDTSMGNDNEGGLTLKYGYMDTDTVGTRDVFNAADSTVFAMLRHCFGDELHDMYIDRENAGAWNLDSFAEICETQQAMACESLWIEDVWKKDIDTYTVLGTSAYIPMLNGQKRLQRRQFLHYQRAFMSSYFIGSYATASNATIRGYTPSDWSGVQPESKMVITPYCDLWVTVRAGSQNVQKRAKAGEAVELCFDNLDMNDTEIYVRNAGFITDLGDLACIYPGYIDISPCSRLQRALIGSDADGYQNTNMKEISVKNAQSLNYINVENCPNLTQELDLSNNINVSECYTRGSGITGITFAAWGRLVTAYLNAVTSIYAEHLNFVTDFTLESYEKLTTLNAAGGILDVLGIAMQASDLVRVRLKDMEWSTTIQSYRLLMKLSEMDGIDDDGHNTDRSVITGSCYIDEIGETKYKALVNALSGMTLSYGNLLEEHTVVFKNDDGTVLYSENIEHRGTADDPITEGYIDEPQKSADVEYTYAFYQWDTPLENISNDTTVTAVYKKTARIYTVNFVDADGTVLESYQVNAHGSCAYSGATLTKSGYFWMGFDQDTDDVVEDMTVTAVYEYPTLPAEIKDMSEYDYAYSDIDTDKSAYTFPELYAIIKSGKVLDYFPVTTEVKMKLDTDVITDEIIVFNLHAAGHYELESGEMSHADFYMTGLLKNTRQMNSGTATNAGGWDACGLREWLNQTLYPTFPALWRALIESSITLASAGNKSMDIIKSTDYLRIPAIAEIGIYATESPYKDEISENAAEITFSQYTDNSSAQKRYEGGNIDYYYTRSPYATSDNSFITYNNGGIGVTPSTNYYAICIGFSA
jgi:hypothetical protein